MARFSINRTIYERLDGRENKGNANERGVSLMVAGRGSRVAGFEKRRRVLKKSRVLKKVAVFP